MTRIQAHGGSGGIESVSNTDSTLTISPTTGAVVASLNLASNNTWTILQIFSSLITLKENQYAAAHTLDNTNFYVTGDTSVLPFTITIPAASGEAGQIFIIKRFGAEVLTIARTGTDTFDGGATSFTLANLECTWLVSDGSSRWHKVITLA